MIRSHCSGCGCYLCTVKSTGESWNKELWSQGIYFQKPGVNFSFVLRLSFLHSWLWYFFSSKFDLRMNPSDKAAWTALVMSCLVPLNWLKLWWLTPNMDICFLHVINLETDFCISLCDFFFFFKCHSVELSLVYMLLRMHLSLLLIISIVFLFACMQEYMLATADWNDYKCVASFG